MVQIEMWGGLTCPFSYLQTLVFHKLKEKFTDNIVIVWRSVERGQDKFNKKPSKQYLENLQIVKKDSFFVSENLTIKAPLTLPNPRQAQEALCFAQTFDKVLELALVFYKSFFESNIDIGEKNVLLQLVNQVGIDSVELEKHLDTRTYTGKVAKDEQKFEIFNFLGVPAMFIGEKNFAPGTFSPLNGFHNFEYLDDMVSHILKNTLQRNL